VKKFVLCCCRRRYVDLIILATACAYLPHYLPKEGVLSRTSTCNKSKRCVVLARVLAIWRALWLRSSASAALLARVTFSSRAVWQRVLGAPQHLALLRQGAARQHLSTFCLAEARCANYTQHLSSSPCSWAPSDAKVRLVLYATLDTL
jgi:hypothetical protein